MTYDPDQLTMFGEDERIRLLREDLTRCQFCGGKFSIEEHFKQNQPSDKEFAEFLRNEYGIGGHSGPDQPMVDYDSKGIRIRYKGADYRYKWTEAAKEIRRSIELGTYTTANDATEYADTLLFYLKNGWNEEWCIDLLSRLMEHPKLIEKDRTRILAALGSGNNTEKENFMTQFEIIMRTDTPELPAEIGNFAEVKAAIESALEQYDTDVAITAETVKDAEKTRAHLRKVQAQIEDYRKDAKDAYLSRFHKLEEQCKELSALIEQPISAIDGKIKAFESEEQQKKWQELEVFFAHLGAPAWLSLADIINPKWKNKTATLEKLRMEISETVCKIEDELKELETLYGASPLWTAISDKFRATRDKSQTLVYAAQIERQHSEEQKRAEAIQGARAQSVQNAPETLEAPADVISDEPAQNSYAAAQEASPQLIQGAFRVTGTREQIKALAQFLKQTGIRFEVIK